MNIEQLQRQEATLEEELEKTREAIRKIEGPFLGKLPNKRAGFHHIHSDSYECGMAYWQSDNDYDYPHKGGYRPCSKLVNHAEVCGFEDNTAY